MELIQTQPDANQAQTNEAIQATSSLNSDNNYNETFPTMGYEPNNPEQDNIGKPTLKEYNVPETNEEWDSIVESLVGLGLTFTEATVNLEKRRKAYTTALSRFERTITKRTAARGRPPGARRTSK